MNWTAYMGWGDQSVVVVAEKDHQIFLKFS